MSLGEYAENRSLRYQRDLRIPAYTPSLETGRPDNEAVTGALPGGIEGTLAVQAFRVSSGDGYSTAKQTVCVTEIPESIAFLPRLYCRDANYRHTRTLVLGAEGFRSEYRSAEFESVAVNRRFAVQVDPQVEEGWLRELFIPTFLDWLAERSPLEFTFELVEGSLCGVVPKALSDSAELDELCELTAHVAERIRSESLEEAAPETLDGPLPPPTATEERREADEAVAKVTWDEPPADLMTAMTAYRTVARKEPGAWGPALKLGGGIALLLLVLTVPVAVLSAGLIGGVGGLVGILLVPTFFAIALGLGGFLFVAARRSQISKRALRYGQRAFVHEYARSRGLEEEDEKAFHARFLRLDLPGPARNVMRGRLPGTNREGRVLLCSDLGGTSAGFGVVVIPAPELSESPRQGDDDPFRIELQHGQLIAYRSVNKLGELTVESLDELCRAADAAVNPPR